MLSYPITLEQDGDTVLATSPDFPELVTYGEDRNDALLHAVGALREAIAARMAYREPVPEPSRGKHRAVLPTQVAVKVALYCAMREQGVKKADLAQRLHWHAPQIDRLFNLNHASRMDQLDAAFGALGLVLDVSPKEKHG